MTTTEYVGPAQLARALGIARQTVNKAESMGKITRSPNGKFDLEQTRRDWIESTHPLRVKVKEPGPAGRLQAENFPLVEFWIKLFNDSAGPVATLLKRESSLTPKEVWHFMALSFLIQWEIVAGMIADGGELTLELVGAAKLLGTVEGQKQLEEWLKKSSRSPQP